MRIGVIGTSWWVDAMYLPALDTLEEAEVVAIAGRSPGPRAERAERWGIANEHADWRELVARDDLDGVIVAASNRVHAPATRMALERGLHVLCEKPLADDAATAWELARLAEDVGTTCMVPFTYAWMPGFAWLERLVREGFVGDVLTVGLRYHTGYALDGSYDWKLDAAHNPTGALGDVGSHFVHLAERLAGEVTAVTADLACLVPRADDDASGTAYDVASDAAVVAMRHASGAQAALVATVVAHEGTSMDQRHAIEVHGTDGVLRYDVDWDTQQEVRGARRDEGPQRLLPIPDDLWGALRRERVHDTYRDVFRTTDAMARGWARAAVRGEPVQPDLAAGARVQSVLDACLASSTEGRRVDLPPRSGAS